VAKGPVLSGVWITGGGNRTYAARVPVTTCIGCAPVVVMDICNGAVSLELGEPDWEADAKNCNRADGRAAVVAVSVAAST